MDRIDQTDFLSRDDLTEVVADPINAAGIAYVSHPYKVGWDTDFHGLNGFFKQVVRWHSTYHLRPRTHLTQKPKKSV